MPCCGPPRPPTAGADRRRFAGIERIGPLPRAPVRRARRYDWRSDQQYHRNEGRNRVSMSSTEPAPESASSGRAWRFDDFVLDTARYELRHGADVIRVEPQVFDVMTQLVSNHDRFVTKEELFDSVWGGRFVGEAALTSRIKAARRALGDDGESQRYIRTIRGRGYQFVGTLVDDTAVAPAPAPEPAPPRQHIAFCHAADG